MGKYDQTVKIWNRISFDIDTIDFDFSYLPHPGIVTNMRWRTPFHKDQTTENTLYTISTDGVLRMWAPFDHTDSSNLQLWLNLDLYDGDTRSPESKRVAFVIDNKYVSKAIETTLIRAGGKVDNSGVQNAISVAKRGPELCVVLNEKRTMTIFSIENVGAKSSNLIRIMKIAENLTLPKRFPIDSPHLSIMAFSNPPNSLEKLKDLSFFVHDYRGDLLHYCAHFDTFLDPAIKKKHITLKSILTGHNKSIQRLLRTADGKSVLSMSRFSENVLWDSQPLEDSQTLRAKSSINVEDNQPIRKAVILNHGDFLVTLIKEKLIVWDCRPNIAIAIAHKKLLSQDDPIAFLLLPEAEQTNHGYHIFALYSNKSGHLWRVSLPVLDNHSGYDTLSDLGTVSFPLDDEIHLAVRVDPVGWKATVGEDIDTFQRDVLATISPTGFFRSWTASLNKRGKVDWLQTACLETGKKNISRMEVSSIRMVAIANYNATELSIWDTQNHILEFQKDFSANFPISDLDWTSTPDFQSILGVGSARVVTLYSQLRFDYTNKTPSWAPVKTIDISEYTTHCIGDSIWLGGGCLAIGAGNQLFIQDNSIDVRDDTTRQIIGKHNVSNTTNNLFEACAILNGPLPFYHPQLLIQCVFFGKVETAKKILVALLKALKFGVVLDSHVIDIESTIGLTPEQILQFESSNLQENGGKRNLFSSNHLSIDDALDEFSDTVCLQLQEWLQKVSLPYMTQHQQITLASVIEAIHQVEQNSRSLDLNGIKFLLGYRLFKIHRGVQESMTIRDFNWVMHSESQDIILGLIENPSSPMLWNNARDVGLPYWARTDKLKDIFEKLGRNYFTLGNRDPVSCSLYYLALRKKQVLIGLWRTAGWNKEQTKTVKLLGNDFDLPKYRTTAQKNAFALLGKHRYEYAAAFFLLGDSLKDCINVLVKQVGDIALAIAVARVYGGDDHPDFKDLLETYVLPKAVSDGDRWMTSWAFWKLGKKDMAIHALVRSPRDIVAVCPELKIPVEELEGSDNKLFLADDPVLIVLYRQLRKKHLKLMLESTKLSFIEEFQFVLKTSYIYSRMGCDVLALDLVKSWDFIPSKDIKGQTPAHLRSPEAKKKSEAKIQESGGSNPFGIDDGFDYNQIKKTTQNSSISSNPFGIDDGFDYSNVKTVKSNITGPFGKLDTSNSKIENTNEKSDISNNSVFKNLKPASAVAFQEPDMNAFDFGF